MDRTEASDAFDAGSIPVGCIFYYKRSEKAGSVMENHHRHKRSFGDRLLDFVYDARDWAVDHGRIVLPVMLSVCVLITVLVGISLYRTQSSSAASSGEDASSGSSQTPLEQNAYSDVDALIKKYFDATADGDTETISGITQGLSDDDKLRIGVVGDYIDSYASVDVYTKPGPVDGSYICFVVTKVIFTGNSTEIPGMQTMYVCTDTDGSLYINENTQSASDTDYIKKVSLDDDVVDLNNKVTAEYNDLVASDSELSSFLNDLSSKIDVSVGEALASASSSGSSLFPARPRTGHRSPITMLWLPILQMCVLQPHRMRK
jgi:hypothetical protein